MLNNIDLQTLGKMYGTDKASHTTLGNTYLDIYEKHFEAIRSEVKVFVEIGILNGNSCKVWESYFPNATIHMVDINPACKQFETERTKIHIGDQNDDAFLKGLADKIDNIDIVIDDGSHIIKHQIKTFQYLYPKLNSRGYYVIEDLRCSYEESVNNLDVRNVWPNMHLNKSNDPLKNYRHELDVFFQSHIRQMDHQATKKLFAIHFYPMIAIFENYVK